MCASNESATNSPELLSNYGTLSLRRDTCESCKTGHDRGSVEPLNTIWTARPCPNCGQDTSQALNESTTSGGVAVTGKPPARAKLPSTGRRSTGRNSLAASSSSPSLYTLIPTSKYQPGRILLVPPTIRHTIGSKKPKTRS